MGQTSCTPPVGLHDQPSFDAISALRSAEELHSGPTAEPIVARCRRRSTSRHTSEYGLETGLSGSAEEAPTIKSMG